MILREFKPEDLEAINSWWVAAGYGQMPLEAFPPTTLIAFDGSMPIAAGSNYLTDSVVCYIDNLVSNPEASAEQRKKAVYILIEALLHHGKLQGKKFWSAHSKLEVIGEWTKKFKETQRAEGHYWFTGEV